MVGVEEAADVVVGEAVSLPEEVVEVQVELLWGRRQRTCPPFETIRGDGGCSAPRLGCGGCDGGRTAGRGGADSRCSAGGLKRGQQGSVAGGDCCSVGDGDGPSMTEESRGLTLRWHGQAQKVDDLRPQERPLEGEALRVGDGSGVPCAGDVEVLLQDFQAGGESVGLVAEVDLVVLSVVGLGAPGVPRVASDEIFDEAFVVGLR